MLPLKDNLSKILSTILIIIRIYHKSFVLFRTNDISVLDCGSPLGKAFSLVKPYGLLWLLFLSVLLLLKHFLYQLYLMVKPYGLFWLFFLSVLLLLKHFVYQLSRCADLSLYFNQFRGRNWLYALMISLITFTLGQEAIPVTLFQLVTGI